MNEKTEGERDLDARKLELASAIGKVNEVVFGAISEIGAQAMLTRDEEYVARDLFNQVFPDLVRGVHHGALEAATKKTVAALVAGLIALREASGSKP